MSRFFYRYKIFLTLFFALAIWQPLLGEDVTTISYTSLTDAKLDTLIVARVGNIQITAKEFLLSYEYGPAFVKRDQNSLDRYLEFMINEKLLAMDGYSNQYHTSGQVMETLTEIEGDLATEELFKEDVMSQVEISEAEMESAVAREKVQVALKWLFTSSANEMKQWYDELRSGASFDSLFALQLNDSILFDDRFLETSRFRLEIKNTALSQIVDTLAFGKISNPVRAPDGWYLVKLADSQANALTTETQEMKIRHEVRRALFKRKMDVLSDQYVRDMMREADPVIQRQTFDLLRAYIGKKVLPPEKFAEWDLMKAALAEFGPFDIADVGAYGDMPLVNLKQGVINLNAFLTWYRTRETVIRFRTSSPEGFFVSLQQIVWRMVRDYGLVQRAYQRGFQHLETVKTQKQWWEEKIVYSTIKADLSQSIPVDDKTLEAYYRENAPRYRSRNGEAFPFDKTKTDVLRDYYSQELNKKLLHRILKLKQQYPIEVYQDALQSLSRLFEVTPDPKAIDVYVVKKGGTYSRPAFPVIDYEWKEWY